MLTWKSLSHYLSIWPIHPYIYLSFFFFRSFSFFLCLLISLYFCFLSVFLSIFAGPTFCALYSVYLSTSNLHVLHIEILWKLHFKYQNETSWDFKILFSRSVSRAERLIWLSWRVFVCMCVCILTPPPPPLAKRIWNNTRFGFIHVWTQNFFFFFFKIFSCASANAKRDYSNLYCMCMYVECVCRIARWSPHHHHHHHTHTHTTTEVWTPCPLPPQTKFLREAV